MYSGVNRYMMIWLKLVIEQELMQYRHKKQMLYKNQLVCSQYDSTMIYIQIYIEIRHLIKQYNKVLTACKYNILHCSLSIVKGWHLVSKTSYIVLNLFFKFWCTLLIGE